MKHLFVEVAGRPTAREPVSGTHFVRSQAECSGTRAPAWAVTATSCGRRTCSASSSSVWHTIGSPCPGPAFCLMGPRKMSTKKVKTVQLKQPFCCRFSTFSTYQLCMSCRSAILQQGNWWLVRLWHLPHGHTLPFWPASSSARSGRVEVTCYCCHFWQLCQVLLPNIWRPRQALDHHKRALHLFQTGPWRRHPCTGFAGTRDHCLLGGP